MGKFFGFLHDIPKSKSQIIALLAVVGLLQVLDYATTKIGVLLNQGGAIESNPLARGIIGFSGGLEILLVLKVVLTCFICFIILKSSIRRGPYDLYVVGMCIFGFLFVFVNNLMSIVRILLLKCYGLWVPMTEADILSKAISSLPLYLGLGIVFTLLGLYIWRRYGRTFVFGPAFICFAIVIFSVINIIQYG